MENDIKTMEKKKVKDNLMKKSNKMKDDIKISENNNK